MGCCAAETGLHLPLMKADADRHCMTASKVVDEAIAWVEGRDQQPVPGLRPCDLCPHTFPDLSEGGEADRERAPSAAGASSTPEVETSHPTQSTTLL